MPKPTLAQRKVLAGMVKGMELRNHPGWWSLSGRRIRRISSRTIVPLSEQGWIARTHVTFACAYGLTGFVWAITPAGRAALEEKG